MKTVRIAVDNEVGLHARPASQFVERAMRFQSEIHVVSEDGTANAKSIIKILSLGITKGTEITLIANGPDEKEALAELCDLIEGRFGEE